MMLKRNCIETEKEIERPNHNRPHKEPGIPIGTEAQYKYTQKKAQKGEGHSKGRREKEERTRRNTKKRWGYAKGIHTDK